MNYFVYLCYSNIEIMIFRNYPILRILIPYVTGACLAYFFNASWSPFFILGTVAFFFLSSFFFKKLKSYKNHWISGVFIQIAFVFIGLFITQNRFQNHLDSAARQSLLNGNNTWIVQIVDHPVEKAKSIKSTVRIIRSSSHKTIRCKALVYFDKKSFQKPQYGDVILLRTRWKEIEPVVNPYSFDYKTFMARKSIFYTAYVSKSQWQKIDTNRGNAVINVSYRIQQYFAQIFAKSGLSGDEYNIITAILLGDDDNMNPALKSSYASAGVSHILCVSGMHVGIIFMILNFLLHPLDFSKPGRLFKSVFLMLFIWLYACITGLSPSVRRAASMFSFVTIGGLLRRNTNIFHSLFASLFILLIINPLLLFDLGFELSYLAVFGIVIFQKKIYELWEPKNRILQYFWNLISVSIAAQISTFPISIYYFGQFPNYFLLANLSVIALSFVVVVSGVALLSVSFIPYLSDDLAWLLTREIRLMNFIVSGIERLPGSVSRNLNITFLQMIVVYALIICVYLLFVRKEKKYHWFSLSTALLLTISFDVQKVQTQNIVNQTVYKINKTCAISFNYHGKATLFSDSIRDKQQQAYSFSIGNHERRERINSVIVSLDTPYYKNEYLLKCGNFVYFDKRSYYLARKKIRYYESDITADVDFAVFLEPGITTEYMKKVIFYKHLTCY